MLVDIVVDFRCPSGGRWGALGVVGVADFGPAAWAGEPCIVLSFGAALVVAVRGAAAMRGVRGVDRALPVAVPGRDMAAPALAVEATGFLSADEDVTGRRAGVAEVEERIDERLADVTFGGSSMELADSFGRWFAAVDDGVAAVRGLLVEALVGGRAGGLLSVLVVLVVLESEGLEVVVLLVVGVDEVPVPVVGAFRATTGGFLGGMLAMLLLMAGLVNELGR